MPAFHRNGTGYQAGIYASDLLGQNPKLVEADATVTAPATNSGNSSLGADSITLIAYTGQATSFAPNVPNAVVSIDGTTGQIDVVADALSTPKAGGTATRVVYDGKFSVIYDSKGKNLAPAGASHIEFDRKFGKILTFNG